MVIDLRHTFDAGVNNLLTWRTRYSKAEYPEKVVLNIFYRKYTMDFMFPDILDSFNNTGSQNSKWENVSKGFDILRANYGVTAVNKTRDVLLENLKHKQRLVGNTSYSSFEPLIVASQNAEHTKLEEIEFAYLYYFLTDETILFWSALGGMGSSYVEAIQKMCGVVIEKPDALTYQLIEQILGQFCVSKYLNENYKRLPPNV